MTLPATVPSEDQIPEGLEDHYQPADGGGFALAVDGVKEHPKVTALSNAYEEEKGKRKELSGRLQEFGDVTPEDVDQLRSELEEAREGGEVDVEAKIEEVKSKLAEKHEAEKQELRERVDTLEGSLRTRTIENELSSALAEAGVKEEYRPAVRAMLKEEHQPTMVETDGGEMVGVFEQSPDGIPGKHPIDEFVEQWSETDRAKPYLEASNTSGSGADPTGGGSGGGGGSPSEAKIEGGMVRTDPAKVESGEVAVTE